MKKTVANIVIYILSFTIFVAGSGYLTANFCCQKCWSEGLDAFYEHPCNPYSSHQCDGDHHLSSKDPCSDQHPSQHGGCCKLNRVVPDLSLDVPDMSADVPSFDLFTLSLIDSDLCPHCHSEDCFAALSNPPPLLFEQNTLLNFICIWTI